MKPGRLLIWLVAAWSALGLAAAFVDELSLPWQLGGLVLLILVVFDTLAGRKPPNLNIERNMPRNLPVDAWTPVELVIRNQGQRRCSFTLFDLHPGNHDSSHLPISLDLAPRQFVTTSYRVFPSRRGSAVFTGIDLLVHSPLRLWIRRHTHPLETQVRVYPNFAEVVKFTLLATDNKLSQMGIRQRQRRGQGMEFHQLREYREGDTLRMIDWKATARLRKLIAREYQDERDQNILFLVDCGRRMRAEDDGMNHFDQCLNAMLLLSYVALRQGDSVSLQAFGGDNRRLAADKGIGHINTLLNHTYDLQTSMEVSDYIAAARDLMGYQRKRSLVVIMTNARDEDQDGLLAAVRLLRSRHLVLIANLREQVLDQIIDAPVYTHDDALLYGATIDYLALRQQNHSRLTACGAMALNVTARELPVAIVNKYIDIKQRNIL